MLIISRDLKKSIRIGDAITITVLDIQDGQVRFGIEAPREIKVMRAELRRPQSDVTDADRERSYTGLYRRNRMRKKLDARRQRQATPPGPQDAEAASPSGGERDVSNL